MSTFAGPFPPQILHTIQEFQGNDKCCDCNSIETDWASVSHGTLLCLECAGKHRSLGVHVSFVRSIHMDTWSNIQVEMMRQGGNEQIREFFRKMQIENSPIETLYRSKAAGHYRDKLKERAEKVVSGEVSSEQAIQQKMKKSSGKNTSLPSNDSKTSPSKPPKKTKSKEELDPHEYFEVRFGDGPMGMTLTKDRNDCALVSRITAAGSAANLGLRVGDVVVGVAGKAVRDYDEIMHMIPYMSRPLVLRIERVRETHKPSLPHNSLPPPPPPPGIDEQVGTPAYRFMATSIPSNVPRQVSSFSLHSIASVPFPPLQETSTTTPSLPPPVTNASAPTTAMPMSTVSASADASKSKPKLRQRPVKKDKVIEEKDEESLQNTTSVVRVKSKKQKKLKPNSQENTISNTSNEADVTDKRESEVPAVSVVSSQDGQLVSHQGHESIDPDRGETGGEGEAGGNPGGDGESGGDCSDREHTSGPSDVMSTTSSSEVVHKEDSEGAVEVAADAVNVPKNVGDGDDDATDAGLAVGHAPVPVPPGTEHESESSAVEEASIVARASDVSSVADGGEDIGNNPKGDLADDDDAEDEYDEEEDDNDDDDDDDDDEDDEEEDNDDEDEEEEEEEDDEEEDEAADEDEDAGEGKDKHVDEEQEPAYRICTSEELLEAGTIVQVYSDSGWRVALVTRRHKDGSYKVTYRDASVESHVESARIAVSNDHNSTQGRTQQQPQVQQQQQQQQQKQQQQHPLSSKVDYPSRIEHAADFVVNPTENLEAWIESDEPELDLNPTSSEYTSLDPDGSALNNSPTPGDTTGIGSDGSSTQALGGADIKVTFLQGPMGMTLTKGYGGRAEVTRLLPEGAAVAFGVCLGDVVVGLNGQWMQGYDEVMSGISSKGFPLSVVFRRGLMEELHKRKPGVVIETKLLAEKMLNQLGLRSKSKGILQSKTPVRLSAWKAGTSEDGHEDKRKDRDTSAVTMTTKVALDKPSDRYEFDVCFGEGDLGMRMEERGGLVPVSVVVSLTEDGQALERGVKVGCTVVGINGERYISHAHTVSTLKHAKRPVSVRFRRMDA